MSILSGTISTTICNSLNFREIRVFLRPIWSIIYDPPNFQKSRQTGGVWFYKPFQVSYVILLIFENVWLFQIPNPSIIYNSQNFLDLNRFKNPFSLQYIIPQIFGNRDSSRNLSPSSSSQNLRIVAHGCNTGSKNLNRNPKETVSHASEPFFTLGSVQQSKFLSSAGLLGSFCPLTRTPIG